MAPPHLRKQATAREMSLARLAGPRPISAGHPDADQRVHATEAKPHGTRMGKASELLEPQLVPIFVLLQYGQTQTNLHITGYLGIIPSL